MKKEPIRRRAREAALVVIAVVALALVVASCGGSDDNKSSSSAVKGPDINAQGEGKLNIVDWEGYTDPSFVKGFEKETGRKVHHTFARKATNTFACASG